MWRRMQTCWPMSSWRHRLVMMLRANISIFWLRWVRNDISFLYNCFTLSWKKHCKTPQRVYVSHCREIYPKACVCEIGQTSLLESRVRSDKVHHQSWQPGGLFPNGRTTVVARTPVVWHRYDGGSYSQKHVAVTTVVNMIVNLRHTCICRTIIIAGHFVDYYRL